MVPPENSVDQKLNDIISSMNKVLVGYSGGVDSTFLLHFCIQILGTENVTAVVIDHPLMRDGTLDEAVRIAKEFGAHVPSISIDLLQTARISSNSHDRCYHCKVAIFSKLTELAGAEGIPWVLDGTNADDTGEYRPGLAALEELGVRSPLKEAGLTKKDIRELSRQAGLPTWNKPSAPCLATRFPYGTELLMDEIERVRQGEKLLIDAGYPDLRLRVHSEGAQPLARLEMPLREMERLQNSGKLNEIVASLKVLGYRYITLDLEGLRSGSMDQKMDLEQI